MQGIRYHTFNSQQEIENQFPMPQWKEEFKGERQLLDFNVQGQKYKACYVSLRTKDISRNCSTWIRVALGVALYILSLNGRLFDYNQDLFKTKLTRHCVVRWTEQNVLALGTEQQKKDFFLQEMNSIGYEKFMASHARNVNYVDQSLRTEKRQQIIDEWTPSTFAEIHSYPEKHVSLFLVQQELKAKANELLAKHLTIESLLKAGLDDFCFPNFFAKDDPRIVKLVLDFFLREDVSKEETEKVKNILFKMWLIPLLALSRINEMVIVPSNAEFECSLESDSLDNSKEIQAEYAKRIVALKQEFDERLKVIGDAAQDIQEQANQYDEACQDIEDFSRKDEVLAELQKRMEEIKNQFAISLPVLGLDIQENAESMLKMSEICKNNMKHLVEHSEPLAGRYRKLQRMRDTKAAEECKEKYGRIVLEYRQRLDALKAECEQVLVLRAEEIRPMLEEFEEIKQKKCAEVKERCTADLVAMRDQLSIA